MILLIGVSPEYIIQRKVQKLSRLSYAENLIMNGKVQNTLALFISSVSCPDVVFQSSLTSTSALLTPTLRYASKYLVQITNIDDKSIVSARGIVTSPFRAL